MALVAGLVLAAGEGRRMGQPKALLTYPDGRTFIEGACDVLKRAGCTHVFAMIGAGSPHVYTQFDPPAGVRLVETTDWQRGMASSLNQGLTHVAEQEEGFDAVIIHLVDLPGVGVEAVQRLLGAASQRPRNDLLRATYGGREGHPVVIGAAHWPQVQETLHGDSGARQFLHDHPPRLVEVGDVATGTDVDTPEDYRWPQTD